MLVRGRVTSIMPGSINPPNKEDKSEKSAIPKRRAQVIHICPKKVEGIVSHKECFHSWSDP